MILEIKYIFFCYYEEAQSGTVKALEYRFRIIFYSDIGLWHDLASFFSCSSDLWLFFKERFESYGVEKCYRRAESLTNHSRMEQAGLMVSVLALPYCRV